MPRSLAPPGPLSLALLALPALLACGKPAPAPMVQHDVAHAKSYTLTCDSVIGPVHADVTYVVVASVEPAPSGGEVTYRLTAPLPQIKPPVHTTFVSSVETLAVPEGLVAESVSVNPTRNADFTSASADLDGGAITFTLQGDFVIDGSERPVPELVITGHVTAQPGGQIVWSTPTSIVGTANAGFFGNQVSPCHFESPGPIGQSSVASP